MIMKWQVSTFMPFMNGDLSFCDVHSQSEYVLSAKPKYYWSHYVQKFNLGFSISLCLSEHLNVFTACLSAEWFFYYKRQSVMCEIVVAMAMSNLGFLFIHSLLVTYKRDFDSVCFCFILLFLMNRHKKGEKWKHASICQGACVRERIIVQNSRPCTDVHAWNQLCSCASKTQVVSFTFWALQPWHMSLAVWQAERSQDNGIRPWWPTSSENLPFWAFFVLWCNRISSGQSGPVHFVFFFVVHSSGLASITFFIDSLWICRKW